MCKEYVHDKVKEVFARIYEELKGLQLSSDPKKNQFKNDCNFMIRKTYSSKSKVNFIIFLVKEEDMPFCADAWEIAATFNGFGEDFEYFILQSMYQYNHTTWYPVPFVLKEGIVCSYDKKELDYSKRYYATWIGSDDKEVPDGRF